MSRLLAPQHVGLPLPKIWRAPGHPANPLSALPTANMQAWFDASVASSFTVSSDEVTQWRDQSGNGNHLNSVYGATARPDYLARTLNGVVVPEANGMWPLYTSAIAASDLTTTRFCVAVIDSIQNTNGYGLSAPLMSCFNEVNLGLHVNTISGTNRLVSQAVQNAPLNPNGHIAVHDTAAVSLGTAYVFSERRNTNTIRMGVNDDFETDSWSPPGAGSNENGLWVFGCHNYRGEAIFDGAIAEMLVYDAVQSDSDMEAVVAYLMGKWGIV